MTPIRPVSEDHRHADYAPRSAALSILRDAGVDETIVAQVSDVLPADPHPAKVDEADLDAFRRIEAIITRHNGRQSEKVDDARLIARERIAALTALTQAPRSCCDADDAAMLQAIQDGMDGWIGITDLQDCSESVLRAIRSNSHAG